MSAGRWLRRAVEAWRVYVSYRPAPSWAPPGTPPAPPAAPPRLYPLRPVHRPPRPPEDAIRARLPQPYPRDNTSWCACGKTWPDTPQGRAACTRHRTAADRGNMATALACAAARKERARERRQAKRAAIRADPGLSEQQRAYDREQDERRRQREAASPQLAEQRRERARELYAARRQLASTERT